jgi:hypothetical protein
VIVVDTTVLIYAVGADHPLAEPSPRRRGGPRPRRRHHHRGGDPGAHPRAIASTGSRRRGDARPQAFSELFAPLLVVDEVALAHGLELYLDHEAIGAFDSVLAAAAIGSGADALGSADRAFGAVSGLAFAHLPEWVDTLGER